MFVGCLIYFSFFDFFFLGFNNENINDSDVLKVNRDELSLDVCVRTVAKAFGTVTCNS